MGMAKACSNIPIPKHSEGEDVEQSLEILDKVLSEFEDLDSLPPVDNSDGPFQVLQSEDDGYMSMNDRRSKYSLGLQIVRDADNFVAKTSPIKQQPVPSVLSSTKTDVSASSAIPTVPSPSTESSKLLDNSQAPSTNNERISNPNLQTSLPTALKYSVAIDTKGPNIKDSNITSEFLIEKNMLAYKESISEQPPSQTTLPKTRPLTVIPSSRYSSLPNSSPPRLLVLPQNNDNLDNILNGGRTVLGINISAVHDAVLRGVARMPESIVNEHPVTIYPGRSSPTKRVSLRTNQQPLDQRSRDARDRKSIGGNNCSKYPSSSPPLSSDSADNATDIDISHSPPNDIMKTQFRLANIPPPSASIIHQLASANNNNNNNNNRKKRCEINFNRGKSDSEGDFSDDSLEGVSLPPPPPPPVVPPPPSLSAPATPNKRGCIAWEIVLDDCNNKSTKNESINKLQSVASELRKKNFAQNNTSMSDSTTSLITSTSGNSVNCTKSADDEHQPEMPICSTEDEAASLHSDSDDIIPYSSGSFNGYSSCGGGGTFVISRGHKKRQALSQLSDSILANNNDCLITNEIQDDSVQYENEMKLSSPNSPPPPPPPLLAIKNSNLPLPFLRHSIDLGSPQPVQNTINFPRSRLSLDLSSPTSELLLPITSAIHPALPSLQPPSSSLSSMTITSVPSSKFSEFATFTASSHMQHNNGFQQQQLHHRHHENNGNASTPNDILLSNESIGSSNNCTNNNNNTNLTLPIMRVSSLNALLPAHSEELLSTPRRELAPPIEEDEDQDSEVQRTAPLRQIENNISALLRGDITVARVGDVPQSQRRPLGFRTGVHKSESAKEMLLFQNIFGPLPPSPPSSGTEESDGFPPLPPSPQDDLRHETGVESITNSLHKSSLTPRVERSCRDLYTDERPPAIPPHRGPSLNTLKTRSMESEYIKSNRMNGPSYTSLHDVQQGYNSRRRLISGAFPKRSIHSPREEKRLQTSCSLPETPIFARGCDVPRTPHRRITEQSTLTGSRTAPRQTTGGLVGGVNPPNQPCSGNTTINGRQRSISQALAGGELLRQAGGPARGWYPRQRNPRPASTENLNRLHPQGSIRAWDMNSNTRKPLTLPPNLTPKFFNKSPREALRRVTSLLIRKGASGSKENKRDRASGGGGGGGGGNCGGISSGSGAGADNFKTVVFTAPGPIDDKPTHTTQKKKGFFKSFWKKSRHYSLEK